MTHVVLVSHGKLAEGLRDTLHLFAKEQVKDVLAVGLRDGEDVSSFGERLKEAVLPVIRDDERVIVIADIIGGSPLTTLSELLEQAGLLDKSIILGGMNLSTTLTVLLQKDSLDHSTLVSQALSEGKAALQEMQLSSAEEDEEDL